MFIPTECFLNHIPRIPSSVEPGSKKVTFRPSPGFFRGGCRTHRHQTTKTKITEKWVTQLYFQLPPLYPFNIWVSTICKREWEILNAIEPSRQFLVPVWEAEAEALWSLGALASSLQRSAWPPFYWGPCPLQSDPRLTPKREKKTWLLLH